MKTTIKTYIILLLASIILAACERDLDIPFPEHEARLVVNSYLSEDQDITVYLTRSYSTLDKVEKEDLWVKDATIQLKEDGVLVATLTYSDTVGVDSSAWQPESEVYAKYTALGIRPKPGKLYQLEISHPTYPDARAETRMPEPPNLEDLIYTPNFEVFRYNQGNGETYIDRTGAFDFVINDPADENNFYDFNVDWIYRYEGQPAGETLSDRLYIRKNPVRDFDGYWLSDDNPTPDSDFNGQQGKIRALVDQSWDSGIEGQPTGLELIAFKVQAFSVSEELYEYRRKYNLQQDNQSEGVESAI
ncbi:MAG: DUF4249 family protein, partial [Bacteroidota bacterium]